MRGRSAMALFTVIELNALADELKQRVATFAY